MISPAAAAAELLARRRARASFTGYCEYRLPSDQQMAAHHRLLTDALDDVERGECDRLLVMMPPGSAKALALSTPIPTPSGWTTMGALGVGDTVFDERGMPCRVTWKSPVWERRPVFNVTTDCGDTIVADRDHEWLVRLCGKPRKPLKEGRRKAGAQPLPNRDEPMSRHKIKETWELESKRAKRPMVKRAGALVLPHADLPVDPYLLGVWLGDGTSAAMSITSGAEDIGWLRGEIHRIGYETSDRSVSTLFGVLGVRSKFVDMGLINDPAHNTHGRKHIPQQYMRASAEQRLALLQGLIDTDGTVCKDRGCTTFCNTNLGLALQVRELVRSLGVKAGWSESPAMLDGKQHGTAYKVSFYMRGSARMPRKAALTRDQSRTPDTYIDVTPAGYEDTVCIEVDSPSHLFLCGRSMTPTHNSTYGSVYFAEYFVGRNPQLSVIAASHTAELAERFGRRVRNGVADQQFKTLFNVELAPDSTAAGRWSTSHGGEYTAVGVGGSITGRRGDLIIVDDPVRSREDADSERIRAKTWDWWVNDLLTRGKPGCRIVVIMTRWHEDDLAGRLLEKEPEKWRVIKLPMIAGEADSLGRKHGERLWHEWFTDEMVQQAQADPRSWISLYQQEPRPTEGAEFRRAWICRFNDKPSKLNKVILVDPAGDPMNKSNKRRKLSDRTVMWVVGLAPDQNAFLIDGIIDRLNLTQRVDALFDLHRKHKPMQVRYERYGMMGDVEAIRAEQERRQYRFKVTEVAGAVEKNARIRRLIPWFEGGRIWFPQALRYTDIQGRESDLVEDLIEIEYATFPVGRFDDGMDCLARLAEPTLTLPWPDEEDDIPPGAQIAWQVMDEVAGW